MKCTSIANTVLQQRLAKILNYTYTFTICSCLWQIQCMLHNCHQTKCIQTMTGMRNRTVRDLKAANSGVAVSLGERIPAFWRSVVPPFRRVQQSQKNWMTLKMKLIYFFRKVGRHSPILTPSNDRSPELYSYLQFEHYFLINETVPWSHDYWNTYWGIWTPLDHGGV